MKKFQLDNQSLTVNAFYNEMEISQNGNFIQKIRGISVEPIQVRIEPLKIKFNLTTKGQNKISVEKDLFNGVYYTNVLDYSLGEISYFANFITEIWTEKVWNLLIEHKENQLIITLQDETIKQLLIQENPSIFKRNEDIDEFCKKYNLRIENFVDAGKFENLEIELEGISARLSSEIIFFRKKIFTELLIQKLNSKIYEYEDVNNYSLSLKKKEIFLNWKQKQIDEIAIVQKYIQSPFTFDNLEQFSSFQSLNDFSAKNYSQQDLISETLYWLNNFLKAKKRFEIALNHYSKNEDLRDGVDNLRLTLELLLKDIFCNNKSLENQLPEIGKYQKDLGISKEIRNTFQKTIEYYNTYQNEHVKHDDSISNRHEAEFIFGLTMLFIRMLIKPNPKFSSL